MIEEAEKQEIIDRAVEKALLLLPEVVGNLLASAASMSKLTSVFYKEHPEFRDHKDVVASVLEMVEGGAPLMRYDELLKQAVPKIRERLKTMQGLDLVTVTKTPPRHLPELEVPRADPVAPYGEV